MCLGVVGNDAIPGNVNADAAVNGATAGHAAAPVARPGAVGAPAVAQAPGAIRDIAVAAMFGVETNKVIDAKLVVPGANSVPAAAGRLGECAAAVGDVSLLAPGAIFAIGGSASLG